MKEFVLEKVKQIKRKKMEEKNLIIKKGWLNILI